jgi:hypothetical protein
MLIGANYKGDKIIAKHAEYVEGQREFCHEMRKDQNNGWSKGRTMRYAGSVPESSIEIYEATHPGFKSLAFGKVKDWKLRDKAIRDFMRWEENKQFTWGNV